MKLKELEVGDILIKDNALILVITSLSDNFMVENEVADLISNTFGVKVFRELKPSFISKKL